MPAAIPAIIAGLSAFSAAAGVAALASYAVVIGVVAAAATYAFSAQSTPNVPGQSGPQVGNQQARGILVNASSNDAPINPIYGARRVGGNVVLRELTGNTRKRLHMIMVLGEGPISAVQSVLFNDKQVTFNKDSFQRDVMTFRGFVDRNLQFRFRIFEPDGVAGQYSGQYNDIASAYATDGGQFSPVSQDRVGQNPWYEGNIDFFPFGESFIRDTTEAVVVIENQDETDSRGFAVQRPSAANNWMLQVSINEPSEGIQQVHFKIRVAIRDKETVSPDLSLDPFSILNNPSWQNWNLGLSGTVLGGFRRFAQEELPDPSYSTASEVYACLGNQWLGNSKSAADEAVIELARSRFPDKLPETSKFNRMALLYVVLDYDPEVYQGVPRITADCIGANYLVDPRTPISGWSDNPIVCTYDYLTNSVYGVDIDVSDIDIQSFIDAANYCDEQITVGTWENQKRYTCNGVIDINATRKANVERLLSSCRGMLINPGGQWMIRLDKPEAITDFTFSEDNIIGGWTIAGGSKDTKFNTIDANFFNPESNWENDVLPLQDADFLAEDNSRELKQSLDLPFTAERWRVWMLAKLALNNSRFGIACEFTATIAALDLMIGDVVKLTHATPGFVDKPFRVVGLTLKPNGTMGVSLIEYDAGAYNFTSPVLISKSPGTQLPDPLNVSAPSYVNIEAGQIHAITSIDGTIVARMYATWGPVTFADYYQVRWRSANSGTWVTMSTPANEGYITDLVDRTLYEVQVRGITGIGSASPWKSADPAFAVAIDTPPPDVLSLTFTQQADGTRQFDWPEITDGKVSGYKIRYKEGSTSDWDSMISFHVGLLTSAPFESNALQAGDYTFAIKASHGAGLESVNAHFLSVSLGPGRSGANTVFIAPHLTFWAGTKTNCMRDTGGYNLEAKTQDDWSDLPSTWAAWTEWAANPFTQFTYESNSYDLGAIETFSVDLTADTTDTSPTLEIAVSDDNVTFGSFHAVAGNETARYIKLKLTVDQVTTEIPVARSLVAILVIQ